MGVWGIRPQRGSRGQSPLAFFFSELAFPSMSLPTVVIAGRPNVGKSTLFNRLVGRRQAIVSDTPGVTRDRKDAQAMLRGRLVRLVDTAGLEESAPDSLYGRMRASSEVAVDEADLVIFVVDARNGITPADEHFAAWLRRRNRPVLLVANKAEGRGGATAALEAYSLGLGEPLAVSAEHGEGITDLMSEIAERMPPEPGLTRDAVSVILHDPEGGVELVDTAGLRKRARIELELEKMSVSASIEALKMAEVVALTIDATEGLHEQDLQIGRLIEREGRACVLVLNKWDAVADRHKQRQAISDRLETSMTQMRGIPVVTVSALTGAGMDKLLPTVRKAYTVWNQRVATGELNRWFEKALERHQPPMVEGRRLKLRYVTQAKARPPTFLVFGTRAEQMPEEYQRYLVNSLRETFDMPGTPIRIQLRGTKNPYADEK